MLGRKFNHFEVFKIVITTIYITSGVVMFGALVSNAKDHWKLYKNQHNEYLDANSGATCQNCDEVD
tara:strand:+ start:105 stop:302 length:198 start_codon:yes stop_codon:yes gene_type:complete